MTTEMFLRILEEAKARTEDTSLPEDARARSAETVALCEDVMMKTASLPDTAGEQIRPMMGHHETKGD